MGHLISDTYFEEAKKFTNGVYCKAKEKSEFVG